jgi:hypothetical protein
VLEHGRTDLIVHGGLSRKINFTISFNYSMQKLLSPLLPPRTLTISMYCDIQALNKVMETLQIRTEVLGFWTFSSSGILGNTAFRKLDLFPSSGEGGGEDTYSVGPLRKN